MADNTLVLCGGTGAHVALAFLRLHTLGASLGYFQRPDGKLFVFPELFLVDQDAGDGAESGPTAWQAVRRLVEQHPGRLDRVNRMGRNEAPAVLDVRPLPLGRNNEWYRPPFDNLQGRFATSPLLPALTAAKQRQIEYSKGMMGSPAVGSLLFKLKEYDEKDKDVNSDERFGALLRNVGRIVVAGSGVGGTGASVTPTLARRLAENSSNSVMATILLSWFKFNENVVDRNLRERAALKNRVLLQNGHSALEFCGQSLANHVATVPIGMPDNALVLRDFTADFGQPVCESFALYVAALSALRHFTSDRPYGKGLYAMGATERGRLDGGTAIPGGTLQDLVNRAATLVDLLEVWQRMLATPQTERIVPSLYAQVLKFGADPNQLANALGQELAHYKEQLSSVTGVLRLKPAIMTELTMEQTGRDWLQKSGIAATSNPSPVQLALSLFHWAADRVRETAAPKNILVVAPAHPQASHWPDLHTEGIGAPIQKNGDLDRVADSNIPAVIQAIVDRRYLSANGWPHPLAAADFFKHAISQRDPTAWRQLEILAVGLASGLLVTKPIGQSTNEEAISLEAVVKEYRRKEGYEGLAQLGVYLPREAGSEVLLAFNSPFTLFAPVPYLDDAADNALWQALWERLSGASDGAPWAQAELRERWREDQAVRVVRAWLDRERKVRGEDAPVWANLFSDQPTTGVGARFGAGPGVKVYWKGNSLVEISLPTGSLDENWIPPPGTPEWDLEELRRAVPELAKSDAYEEFSFEMPGEKEPVRGLWRDHLLELQQAGKIFAFGQLPGVRQVALGSLVNGELRQTILSNTLLLGRSVIAVQQVTPLEQRPVFDGESNSVLYPDLPIRPEFIGLVQTPSGSLLDLMKQGQNIDDLGGKPREGIDSSGRPMVTWSLQLRGRRDPLVIPISLAKETPTHAHWMIWPRFRSQKPSDWKAYYIYDYCRNQNLICDVLWVEGVPANSGELRLKERQHDSYRVMEPLNFKAAQAGSSHTGGPPIALSLRDQRRPGDSRGLYLVRLETLPSVEIPLNLAFDFGTAHSVVAIEKVTAKVKEVVELPAELDVTTKAQRLSLHLSEDREHLVEVGSASGEGLDSWMPNYRKKVAAMVPSELYLYRPLNLAKGDDLSAWKPLQHYTIPPLNLARKDIGKNVVSGFKWDASSIHFQGREPQLREHYQSLLLELFFADIVANRLRSIPSNTVGITFCYPLRSQDSQIGALKANMDRVLLRTVASTGIRIEPFNKVGLLDESRAAAVRRGVGSEVCMVADLGGGTLDILISGYDPQQNLLEEIADSARLGGNMLLSKIAENAEAYLPRGGGWDDPEERFAKLVAWVRGLGTSAIWGIDAGSRPSFSELGALGFEKAAEGDSARALINRYFNLIIEFLARNLAAYLVDIWYPRVTPLDHERLSLTVQLRGNGWRLRYRGDEGDVARNQAIQELVCKRLAELWPHIPGGQLYPFPKTWLPSKKFQTVGLKTESAKGAVGQAMKYEEVRGLWHTRTLVELEVALGTRTESIDWTSRVPFESGGEKKVQLTRIFPAVPIDPDGVSGGIAIDGLDAELQREVNRALQEDGRLDGTRFTAPVSAEVWEALFSSSEFWPHRKG